MADESSVLRRDSWFFRLEYPLQVAKGSGYINMQDLSDGLTFLSLLEYLSGIPLICC